jgi:hypothetical protein
MAGPLNLRRSITGGDGFSADTLPMMLMSNNLDSLPRLPLSLSSSMLDMLSSLRPEEQDQDQAA